MNLQPGRVRQDDESDADFLLRTALDVAVQTLKSGGEIHRVEETIERICRSHGAAHVEVFAISTLILASVRMEDGSYSSQTRRLYSSDNSFVRLTRLNDISRALCEGKMTLSEAQVEIVRAKRAVAYPSWVEYLGAFLFAGGFCVFYRGSLLDALCAGLLGALITLIGHLLPASANQFAVMVLSSFLGGCLSAVAVRVGIGQDGGMIFIGMIMILVPGLAFGNALRDLLSGDTLTGMLGLIRSVLLAASIAFGLFAATALLGGLAV